MQIRKRPSKDKRQDDGRDDSRNTGNVPVHDNPKR